MGKGSRLRKQKMSKENELTNANTKQELNIKKANIISQSIVGISNAYYHPDGRLMIDVSRETRRADLDKLSAELAKVGIKADYSYPNIQRGEITVAAESVAEDYLDDINSSVPNCIIDIGVDKAFEFKKKYEYSIKFDDYSLIMKLPYDDITFNVIGTHKYKARVIINKTEIQDAVKEINRKNKAYGTNIVGYILYKNESNPDEWATGVPIHLYRSYKNKKDASYQLFINIADGIFAASNKYEIRKKFRYKIIEGLTNIYSPQLLDGIISVWNSLVRAITDPEMKEQWKVEEFKNENGYILTKYTHTNTNSGKSLSKLMMKDPKVYIEKIDSLYTQSEILTTMKKIGELLEQNAGTYDIFENEVPVYMKSPYTDFIVTLDDKWHYRIILDKEKIQSVTNSSMYNRKYSEPVGIIMIDSREYSEYMMFGLLSFETFLDRMGAFKLTINNEMGISIYEHDESKLQQFQKNARIDFGIKDATEMISFITVLPTLIKALNNPEVKEVWETKDVKISDNPDLKKCFPKRPLENIKRIYMCEHTPIDREIERHTDKWFVKGHEVHMKNGTTYFRRGYYKGPARLDEKRIVEPRKRTLNTVCNDVKKDLDDFYNLLK